jgi:hypothetical protein
MSMRFKVIILLVCLVITILLLWLFWLAFVILISIVFYFFFNLIVFKHLIKNKWVQGLFKVIGLFILSIIIRMFCIDIYTVSGESIIQCQVNLWKTLCIPETLSLLTS